METRTPPTPTWAAEYLEFDAWTQDEFRNLLCGLPPVPPEDAPARTREQIANDFVRDERRRVAADRHIRDAILAGHLKVLAPPDERLLPKITPHVTAEELAALRRAIVHDVSCSKAFHVAPAVAIRWARLRRNWFPKFPLMDAVPLNSNANVPSRLPRRLALLVEIMNEAPAGIQQKEITDSIKVQLEVSDRDAQAYAALIRPDDIASQDGRAARRRRRANHVEQTK